ncbi:hypothetical protein T265_05156 [Opisthorchis viverrini]|uniref:Uncharacterized protein n=1 Tax=Opisthorchis viverrini TaxID=6198 RepID=A0A074ZKL7_OPIVI|nr:hypothetical protein T265_05156 [Opisthorchis viverrini]KER27873.1 hypothetical protein T265_05156 [Opisthorchis viverrini]
MKLHENQPTHIVSLKHTELSEEDEEWRKQRGGQPFTWQRGIEEITKRFDAVGATHPPGWGPRAPHCAWLKTLKDMASNRYRC